MVVYLGFLKKNWIYLYYETGGFLQVYSELKFLLQLANWIYCANCRPMEFVNFQLAFFTCFAFVFVTLMFCVLIIDKADLKCNGLLQLLQFLHHPLDNKLPQLPRLYCYCSSPSPTIYVPSRTTTIHLSFDQCELHRVKNHLCH